MQRRRRKRSLAGTGVRNVYRTAEGRYRVRFRDLGRKIDYGTYDTLEDAQAVAEAARERLRSTGRRERFYDAA